MQRSCKRSCLCSILTALAIALFAAPHSAHAQTTGVNTPPVTSGSPSPLYLGDGGNVYMNINPNGNIGIGMGTSAPAAQLEVYGGGLNVKSVVYSGAATAYSYFSVGRTGDEIQFGVAGASGQFFTPTVQGTAVIKNYGSGDMMIGNGSANPAITILNPSNNVGIGVTSPQTQLDVQGAMRATSPTVITGGSCAVEGALSYDMTNHKPVYCSQSLSWTSSATKNLILAAYTEIGGNNNANYYLGTYNFCTATRVYQNGNNGWAGVYLSGAPNALGQYAWYVYQVCAAQGCSSGSLDVTIYCWDWM